MARKLSVLKGMAIASLLLLVSLEEALAQPTLHLEVGNVTVSYGEEVSIPVWISTTEPIVIPRSILRIQRFPKVFEHTRFEIADSLRSRGRAFHNDSNEKWYQLFLDTLGVIDGRRLLGHIVLQEYVLTDTNAIEVKIDEWEILSMDSISTSWINGSFRIACFDAGSLQLNFKWAINNWPTIELFISAFANNRYLFLPDSMNYRIRENGKVISPYDVWVTRHPQTCLTSTAIVLDQFPLDSLNRLRNYYLSTFLYELKHMQDEYFISINDMKNPPPLLNPWLELPTASGKHNSKLLDGIYDGINFATDNGKNPCRAVIVFTHGKDSLSARTAEDVISLAHRNRIRVFIVLIADSSNPSLETLARTTGGNLYLNPDPYWVANLYWEISTTISQGIYGMIITYVSNCLDASTRNVSVQLVTPCGVSEIKTKSYKALLDSTTFTPVPFEIGSASTTGWSQVTVPLTVKQAPNDWLRPFTMTIAFDPRVLRFSRLDINGTLLAGHLVITNTTDSTVTISVMNELLLDREGVLLNLIFVALNPSGGGTSTISATRWAFERGCYRAEVESGEIRVTQNPTSVGALGMPGAIRLGAAYPNPVTSVSVVTTIPIFSGSNTVATVKLFDALGREVAKLFEGKLVQGENTIRVPAEKLAPLDSGTYFYRLTTQSVMRTGLLHLMK